ncbi:hypothetical protein F5878DRAFT_577882 [Lentinula raphanica]|uniref:E3 ubiquitin-protein ligase listerin n=1 Tax=Lentinula raphanica TaxID=153919 RepID=A0AA38PF35_9AGAR|nr:hypothetical protein F5878DRAFT_577882 [Lentinula raphanica]
MPKALKKAGQSSPSSHNPNESGSTTPKTKADGPPKSNKKRKDGGGVNKKQKLSKKELKELEKQQRQKAYVAPTKPLPIKPDPLDSTGLAYVLPAELVIVLRNLGKKAVKTREKALDELDAGWVNTVRAEGKERQEQILIDMLPVWLSHLPQLLLHSSRRIRLAAANVHRSFVSISAVSDQLRLQLDSSSQESADAIGTWALATYDIDPVVANVAAESWRRFFGSSLSFGQHISSYAQRAILDPGGLYAYLYPVPPPPSVSTNTPSRKDKQQTVQKSVKGKATPTKTKHNPPATRVSSETYQPQSPDESQPDSLETETDRDARIRVGGLGSLTLFLSNCTSSDTFTTAISDSLGDARLWSSLSSSDPQSFGFEQPAVRKAAWRLVGALNGGLGLVKDTASISRFLRILSSSIFHSAWNEQDAGVQGVMWQPLLRFLKDHPDSWQWEMDHTHRSALEPAKDVEGGSDSDSESSSGSESERSDDEDGDVGGRSTSRAYEYFLSFLSRGCNGSPVQAYPAVMVVLSTIPSDILLASYSSESHSVPFDNLFSSLWTAVESTTATPNRMFSGPGADKASKAFVETLLECLVFLTRRTTSQSQTISPEAIVDTPGLITLIQTQFKRVWEEVVGPVGSELVTKTRALKVSGGVLGAALARALRGLRGISSEEELYDAAWQTVSQSTRDRAGDVVSNSVVSSRTVVELASHLSDLLKALNSDFQNWDPPSSDARQLLEDVFAIALDGCERSLLGPGPGFGGLTLLTKLIHIFGSSDEISEYNVITRIDTLLVQNALKLLLLRPSGESNEGTQNHMDGKEGLELLATYLLCRESRTTPTNSSQITLLWLALLEQVVEQSHSLSEFEQLEIISRLISLLNVVKSRPGGLEVVSRLKPVTSELDGMIMGLAQERATYSSISASTFNVVRDILLLTHGNITEDISHPLLPPASLVNLIETLVFRFKTSVEGLLGIGSEVENISRDKEEVEVSGILDNIDRLLVLTEVILGLPNVLPDMDSPEASSSSTVLTRHSPSLFIIPNVFLLAHALPRGSLHFQEHSTSKTDDTISRSRDELCAKARRILDSSIQFFDSHDGEVQGEAQPELVSGVTTSITQSLQTLLSNTNTGDLYSCTPEDVVAMYDTLRNTFISKALKGHVPSSNSIDTLLPSQSSLDALLDTLSRSPIHRSLGVVDELAGVVSLSPSSFVATPDINSSRAYARYALALLRIVSDDLGMARGLLLDDSNSWWVLRHLFALSVYAEEVVAVSDSSNVKVENPLFHLGTARPGLLRQCKEIIGKVHQIVAYTFASVESAESTKGSREWRKVLCRMLSAPVDASLSKLPAVGAFTLSVIRSAVKTDCYRDCCVVREVLSRLLQAGLGSASSTGISEEEFNSLLNYARTISEPVKGESARAPLTGITIISTLMANLPASTPVHRLDRYRNELASSLLGVPSSRATSDGLRILLTLVLGTAPDVDSEAEFLPVQRAVNVIKACQKWVEGDEGDDEESDEGTEDGMEELESVMTLAFFHLAPILQNVPGGHWQFIFDVLENNIENSDFKFVKLSTSSPASSLQLLTLARTLRLIGLIQDLSATNKSLKAEWNERKTGIMTSIRDMILDKGDPTDEESDAVEAASEDETTTIKEPRSVPEGVCQELVLELVANYLPDELIDHESFPKMCHLLSSSTSTSFDADSVSCLPSPRSYSSSSLTSLASPIHHAQIAYQILHKAAKKRTEHFVLEAGLDTEGKLKAQLPKELMVLLQQSLNLDIDADDANLTDSGRENEIFVYLLGWMLLFDSFADTSMKVRMNYIEQIRNSNVIEEHFIPSIFSLLSLDRGIVKAYKLDMWGVDEFYVQLYEAGSSSGLQTLAAHLYYRALLTVPSLIHNWLTNCRDRQLSSTIASYTQSHFSPVLIRTELNHVKSPEAQSEFASDENPLSVKVASGAVNEVTATYSVDDQQLEIRLRIPGDWPLHRIEIRDTKKVGVDDNRWRAWILGVQQTIWAQNGRIVDGLALFKKNVAGHFEGQVECAICYSLINVNDGLLPKKPCNTCKNRFHAGCLYKWFNSSHSSSCPLCRSDILH